MAENDPRVFGIVAYYFVFLAVGVTNAAMLLYTRYWGTSQPSYHRDRVGDLCAVSACMLAYCILKATKTPSIDALELIAQFGIGMFFNITHYRILKIQKCEGCIR